MRPAQRSALVCLLVACVLPLVARAGIEPGPIGPGPTSTQRSHTPDEVVGSAILSGADRAKPMCPPVFIIPAEAAGDEHGYSVAGAGDVNGDGYGDIVVGAFLNDAGGADAGRAYVYSGLTGDLIYEFTGEGADDHFGSCVASAGDVNNDGYADVIIGAPLNDAGGADAGRVYVFSGQTGDTLYVFTGEADNDWLGWAAAGAGDVNADGYDDMIVGAPQSSAGVPYGGRAYVFSGLDGSPLYIFDGELDVDVLGTAVASAGDIDNDGYADVIISAYLYGAANTGRVYLFSGRTGDTLQIFDGEAANDHFGHRVAPVGDVDGDNVGDVMVGAPLNDAGAEDAGRVYVFSGQTGDVIYTFTGEWINDQLGYGISGVGNIDGDGVDDLAVGAWGNNAGGLDAGRLYVYSGRTGDTIYVIDGEVQIDWLGASVASIHKQDPLDFDDLIVGVPGVDYPGINGGGVYVYRDACCCEERGDCDLSGDINVADLTYLVTYIFRGGLAAHCTAHGDVDGDGAPSVADVTYLVAYLFRDGAHPPACW